MTINKLIPIVVFIFSVSFAFSQNNNGGYKSEFPRSKVNHNVFKLDDSWDVNLTFAADSPEYAINEIISGEGFSKRNITTDSDEFQARPISNYIDFKLLNGIGGKNSFDSFVDSTDCTGTPYIYNYWILGKKQVDGNNVIKKPRSNMIAISIGLEVAGVWVPDGPFPQMCTWDAITFYSEAIPRRSKIYKNLYLNQNNLQKMMFDVRATEEGNTSGVYQHAPALSGSAYLYKVQPDYRFWQLNAYLIKNMDKNGNVLNAKKGAWLLADPVFPEFQSLKDNLANQANELERDKREGLAGNVIGDQLNEFCLRVQYHGVEINHPGFSRVRDCTPDNFKRRRLEYEKMYINDYDAHIIYWRNVLDSHK